MSLEDFQLIYNETIDISILKRDFLKNFHQQAAKMNDLRNYFHTFQTSYLMLKHRYCLMTLTKIVLRYLLVLGVLIEKLMILS